MVSGEKTVNVKAASVTERARQRLERKVYRPWAQRQSRQQLAWLEQHGFLVSDRFGKILVRYFEYYFLDVAGNDSTLMALKESMPGFPLPRQLNARLDACKSMHAGKIKTPGLRQLGARIPGISGFEKISKVQVNGKQYLNDINTYAGRGQAFSGNGNLKAVAATRGEAAATAYVSKMGELSELGQAQAEVSKLQGMPGHYQSQVAYLQDSAYLKDQARKKAEEIALNYLTGNPQIIQGVQRKMSLLMKKYSFLPNSNDLSSAVKNNSLKGRNFGERLVIGGNFQILNLKPFTIDLSPSLGYKLNRDFVLGIGGNYRQTFSADTIPRLAPQVFGYKAFASHNVWRNFFAYGKFDRNSPGVKTHEGKASRVWKNAAFAGIGRKIAVHKKVEMTVLVVYNFLHRQHDPVYPRPLVIKVGFQTSEIAMLKKRS